MHVHMHIHIRRHKVLLAHSRVKKVIKFLHERCVLFSRKHCKYTFSWLSSLTTSFKKEDEIIFRNKLQELRSTWCHVYNQMSVIITHIILMVTAVRFLPSFYSPNPHFKQTSNVTLFPYLLSEVKLKTTQLPYLCRYIDYTYCGNKKGQRGNYIPGTVYFYLMSLLPM